MRHQVAGRKLKRTHSHRKALLHNLATQLFEHKKVQTTEAKAKELRPFAERLITKAKNALIKERQGELPSGQTIDIHNRRQVGRVIRNKAVLQELFDSIAPAVESRNGGFTRVIKTGVRRGDNAKTAIIELVDFAAEQDGAISTKRKKKQVKKTEPKPQVAPVILNEEKVEEVIEVQEEVVENTEVVETSTEESVETTVDNVTETTEENAPEKIVFEDTSDDAPIQNDAEAGSISENTEENKA